MKCKYLFFISLYLLSQITFSQEKTIASFVINGAKKTKISFLKSLIDTRVNTPLDSIMLKKDVIELKRLSAIRHAGFQVKELQNNKVAVSIYIEENFTIIPDVSFWSATNNVFAYKLGVYEYNFLGRNITIGGFYQNNGFSSTAFNFKAPNLFSKNWGLAFNYLNWKSKEPIFVNGLAPLYLYNNRSFEALGLYKINFKNKIDFGINFFREKFNYLSGDIPEGVVQELDENKTLFKTVYTYDSLDYYYHYVSGFKSVFYGQYVITDNEAQDKFLIAWNDFFYYKRVKKKGNWATRLRFGLATNNDSPFAPFALDNNVNVRGVGVIVDRGTGSIILNTEYRHTLYDKKNITIQTNTFLDAGTWRNPGGSFNDFTNTNNMRVYSGIGLRFISKKIYNATFRIDYGFSLTNGLDSSESTKGLVFGLGQYF